MAATTIDGAIQTKFAALSFTGKPSKLWFGEVPLRDGSSVISLPVARFYLPPNGKEERHTFESLLVEFYRYVFEVYSESKELAETIAYGILYSGQKPELRAGMVNPDSFTMPSQYAFLASESPQKPVIEEIPLRSDSSLRVFLASFQLLVTVQRVA